MLPCPYLRVAVSLTLLLLACHGCARPPRPETLAAPVFPRSLTATCHAVDARGRTLEVVTGVGLAFRQVRFVVEAGCRITSAGSTLTLEELDPGEVVRILYRSTGEGNVAEAIVLLPVESRRGEP